VLAEQCRRVEGDRSAAGPLRRAGDGRQNADELGLFDEVVPKHFSVKESVFPFNKFPGVDIILGPEMRSTGEVMGIDDRFPMRSPRAKLAAKQSAAGDGQGLHLSGRPRQGRGGADRAGAGGDGLSAPLDARHCSRAARRRHPGGGGAKIQEGRPNWSTS